MPQAHLKPHKPAIPTPEPSPVTAEMSCKRMGDFKPRKLTSFMFPPEDKVSTPKDGGVPREAYTDLPDESQNELGFSAHPLSPTLDPGIDPLNSSPAKAWMRMDAAHPRPPLPLPETRAFNPFSSNQALHSSMVSFPTTRQPIIDTTLKYMLMSLQSSLTTDLSSLLHKISTDMQHMDRRIT